MASCQSFYLNGKIFDYIIVYFAFLCVLLNIKQSLVGKYLLIHWLTSYLIKPLLIFKSENKKNAFILNFQVYQFTLH